MKTKLLRKIRTRIVSIEFCDKLYANITYYNRHNEVAYNSVYRKQHLLSTIRDMFGSFFANVVEYRNKKTNFKRAKKKLNSSIKYTWNNEKNIHKS